MKLGHKKEKEMKKGLKELLKENINNYVIVNGGASQYLWFDVPNGKNCDMEYMFHFHFSGKLHYSMREKVTDSSGRRYCESEFEEMAIDSGTSIYRLVKLHIEKWVGEDWYYRQV